MSKYDKPDQDKQLRLMEVSEDISSMRKAPNPAHEQVVQASIADRSTLEDLLDEHGDIILH